MKKISEQVRKTIYLPESLIKQTEDLMLYTDCRGNFSLYVEIALKEKNKRVKKEKT